MFGEVERERWEWGLGGAGAAVKVQKCKKKMANQYYDGDFRKRSNNSYLS